MMVAATMYCRPIAASDHPEIDARVTAVLETFSAESPEGKALLNKAAGALVFPDVYKVGFGIGGEYGEGALLIAGKPVSYYSTSGASFGLQLGAQAKSQVILFMTQSALARFRRSKGWEAGVDGSIAVVREDASGGIDTTTAQQPVIGFVFSNKGLMYNLSLEGSKITPLES
jgi:lipid-binding SYLF domain-containing protein